MGCVEGGFRSRSPFSYPPPSRVREKTSHDRSESRVNDLGSQKSTETALIEATTDIHAVKTVLSASREFSRQEHVMCVLRELSQAIRKALPPPQKETAAKVQRKWTKIELYQILTEHGCLGSFQTFRGPDMKYLNLFRTPNKH